MDKRLQRGWILLDQRRYAQAEIELKQALAADVDKVLGLYWLGWAQFSLGKYDEAEISIGRCIAENPARGEGYHARAVLMRKRGDLAKAEEAARLALQKSHFTVEYRAELAWILMYRARPQEALDLLDDGLANDPQSVDLHRARTQSLIDLRKLDEARESALRVLALDPEDATGHRQLGSIAFQQKDYDEAARRYSESLRIDPTYDYARTALLNALRHRIWYYRLLVPKNTRETGRRRNVWFYALIAAGAAIRALPAAGAAFGGIMLVGLVFVLGRWYLGATVSPITTLLLRLNPMARATLPAEDIECSNFVGLMLVAAVVFFLAALLGSWHGFFAIGLVFMLLIVPLTRTYQERGLKRTVAECYLWLLFSLGCGSIAALAQDMFGLAAAAFMCCVAGAIAFTPMTALLGRILSGGRRS